MKQAPFYAEFCFSFILPYLDRGGGRNPPPPRFFLHNSKTPGDIEKKLSDFNFTPLMDILIILSITIVVNVAIATFSFQCVTSFFGLKKQRNLNYF